MEYLEKLSSAPAAGGAAPPRALAVHLAECARCTATVEAARQALAALSNLSPGSRSLCPPPEELVEVPSGVAKLSVRLHVALCADCREDLADLECLEAEPPSQVVARWLADGFAIISQTLSGLAPQPVPLAAARGGSAALTGWRIQKAFEDVEVKLELAPGDGRSFALAVGLAPRPPAGTRVDLESCVPLQPDRLLESRAMDATGLLSFLGLAPGQYRVTVRRPHTAPLVTQIDVGA